MPQLEFDLGDLNNRSTAPGRRLTTCMAMVQHLADTGRLDAVHIPLVEHLYGLCEALDGAHQGRGASYALLSAQWANTWERLATLPLPEADDDGAEADYDVVVLRAVEAPAENIAQDPAQHFAAEAVGA